MDAARWEHGGVLDPVSALLLDEAGELPRDFCVIDDAGGALCRALPATKVTPVAHCDDIRDEAHLPATVRVADSLAEAVTGASLVIARLPKGLDALEELAATVASLADPAVRLVAGGRVKHMTRAQNDVLGRHFAHVRASLGRQKSRVLHASAPRSNQIGWPRSRRHDDLGLSVVAHGRVFAGNRLDAGTRLLLDALATEDAPAPGGRAVDLGSGSGVIAAHLARRGWSTSAVDVSAAAVASTLATASANGVTVDATRGVGLNHHPDASAEIIVTNPPFHVGEAKDSTPTIAMLADAGRVLAPGGRLWVVWNAHLPYLPLLRRIGPTSIVRRDPAYLVTRTLLPGT